MKIIYCLIRTVNNFTWTFTVLWFCGSSSSVWSFELLLTLVFLGKPAGTQFKSHTVFLSISVHHGWRSGVPPEVTNQSDVVRGVSHAGQSLIGGDLLEAGQRDHLLHLHTHHICVTSVIHTKNTWLHFYLSVIFFLNNQSPLSLFSVPHLWLSENLRNLSFFTRFTNSFLIYFKLSKWLAQDLNN